MYSDERKLDFCWWAQCSIYGCLITMLHTWNLYNTINQCYINKNFFKYLIKASVKGQMTLWEFISAYNTFGGQLGYLENNSQKYRKIKIINLWSQAYRENHFQWQTINELQRAGSTSSWIIFNFFTSTKTSRITLVSRSHGS